MLELATITLTVFSYVTEENDRVVDAIYNAIGAELKGEKLTKIGSTSQFGDPFVIYSFETDNSKQVELVVQNLADALDERSKQYLADKLEQKIDLDERTLYLRIDKYKAYQDVLVITEGSDVIKIEISYNAYSKKSNTIENLRKFFIDKLLLEE